MMGEKVLLSVGEKKGKFIFINHIKNGNLECSLYWIGCGAILSVSMESKKQTTSNKRDYDMNHWHLANCTNKSQTHKGNCTF